MEEFCSPERLAIINENIGMDLSNFSLIWSDRFSFWQEVLLKGKA
jgi:hypothetical protein